MSSPEQQRVRRWARSGCVICKRRRKKCDEAKPRCDQCSRLDLDCSYDSLWMTPTTQENKPRRRTRVLPGRTLPGWDAPVSGVDAGSSMARPDSPPYADAGKEEDVHANGPSLLVTPPMLPGSPLGLGIVLNPAHAHYLRYYTTHLSRLLVMVDAPSNPLRTLVIPRLASSPMLLQAVCAVSACHYSQQRQIGENQAHATHTAAAVTKTFGLRSYTQAMNHMARCLSRFTDAGRENVDEILLTVVFLCKYEIIRGSTHEWRHHLTGLTQLMRHPVTVSGLSPETRKYLQSFITYHCEVAAITSSGTHGSCARPDDGVDGANGSDSAEVDTYMGFTKSIVGLFGRISELSRIGYAPDRFLETSLIHKELQSWSINNQAQLALGGVPQSSIRCLQSTAVAYHLSAVIYFYTVTASLGTAAFQDWWQNASLPPLPSKHAAVTQCFAALRCIPDGTPGESALVLPLFIMGCESESLEYRNYTIGRLRRMETTIGLGNISLARMVVEQVQETAINTRSEAAGMAERGPRWNRATDNLGWDLIVT